MENQPALYAISPVDGRYSGKSKTLQAYFSEFALIKYRVKVEIEYFIALCDFELAQLAEFPKEKFALLRSIYQDFSEHDAVKIKTIESVTNHDVKAVEYFIKEQFERLQISKFSEFIHFGLTSQDINNTAFPMMIKDALESILIPQFESLVNQLEKWYDAWKSVPMLARTHGQPASPTTIGKEMMVFAERLHIQLAQLKVYPIKVKFGGATGNFNAHKVSFPDKNWLNFADRFTKEILGIERSRYTTQIAHYDDLAAIFQNLSRLNTILIDYCRDIWTYISMDYFKQQVVANEVGSSAMPHKVNPIDFENAEGNLGMANATFQFLANKLPISRLQRDLTDSTVLRNIGVPFAHTLIAILSVNKGNSKLLLNEKKMADDLEQNWAVVAEAIQNILRREGYEKPYEALKTLTRGSDKIDAVKISRFIDSLNVSESIKEELHLISPSNYIGYQ
jgi:adenylosuccinate lyase